MSRGTEIYTSPVMYLTEVMDWKAMCSSIALMEPGSEQDDYTF